MGSVGTNVIRCTSKGKSKAALRTGVPRNVRSMSKEVLEATLQKKRECNAKAQEIVESLLEKNIKEEWFIQCLKYINDTHFQDVVEERAITKLCGYPLCDAALKNVPNQQYKICTNKNKVYDLTERKNFCSNECYKASKYLKDQLLTSPLWLRDKEEIPEFKILTVGLSRGIVGEEVNFGHQENLRQEITQLKNSENNKIGHHSSEPSIIAQHKNDKECETNNVFNSDESVNISEENNSESCKIKSVIEKKSFDSKNDMTDKGLNEDKQSKPVQTVFFQMSDSTAAGVDSDVNCEQSVNVKSVSFSQQDACFDDDSFSSKSEKLEIQNKDRRKSREKSSVNKEASTKKQVEAPLSTMLIEKCLREWFTLDSMYFLFGEETMREMVAEKDITHYYKPAGSDSWEPGMRERYVAICKKLNLMELEDISYDSKITNENKALKPLPEYSSIKEEGMKMQLKVRAFFGGKTAYEDISADDETQCSTSSGNFLPLVDLHSKNALRRRIVLDRFNRILPDLLSTFGMSSRDISDDLRSLVSSFCLSAHNITFKPTEWNLLGLTLLKMLSIKDQRIKAVLETEQARKYVTMMLMVFQEEAGYLDRLLTWLTDIDFLLQQHSCQKGS